MMFGGPRGHASREGLDEWTELRAAVIAQWDPGTQTRRAKRQTHRHTRESAALDSRSPLTGCPAARRQRNAVRAHPTIGLQQRARGIA